MWRACSWLLLAGVDCCTRTEHGQSGALRRRERDSLAEDVARAVRAGRLARRGLQCTDPHRVGKEGEDARRQRERRAAAPMAVPPCPSHVGARHSGRVRRNLSHGRRDAPPPAVGVVS
jgi:hypothetical protein